MKSATQEYLQQNRYFETWEYIEEFCTGNHWGQDYADSPEQVFPAVQLSWKTANSIHAKVFNQPLRPIVTPEERTDFPVEDNHPWREAVANNMQPYKLPNGQPVLDPVLDPNTGQVPIDPNTGGPILDPNTGAPPMQPRMQSPFQGETDNEIAAELLTAALDYVWEKNDLEAIF